MSIKKEVHKNKSRQKEMILIFLLFWPEKVIRGNSAAAKPITSINLMLLTKCSMLTVSEMTINVRLPFFIIKCILRRLHLHLKSTIKKIQEVIKKVRQVKQRKFTDDDNNLCTCESLAKLIVNVHIILCAMTVFCLFYILLLC